jgi:hypothetical protein
LLTKRCPFVHARHCGRTRLDGAPQQPHGIVDSNPVAARVAVSLTCLSAGFLPIALLRVPRSSRLPCCGSSMAALQAARPHLEL